MMKNRLLKVFKRIYNENSWSCDESISGGGSTVEYTKNLQYSLPILINQFNIKSVLDMPCGDFNWMKFVLPQVDVNYIGGDIVSAIIDSNKIYETSKIKFVQIDITIDKLPDADLLICRDCLFHLPNYYIELFFKNFAVSNVKYLLTTTHINDGNSEESFKNYDIKIGGFRKIDLFSEPYHLSKNVLYRIPDYVDGFPPREMVMFSKEQIAERYQ